MGQRSGQNIQHQYNIGKEIVAIVGFRSLKTLNAILGQIHITYSRCMQPQICSLRRARSLDTERDDDGYHYIGSKFNEDAYINARCIAIADLIQHQLWIGLKSERG